MAQPKRKAAVKPEILGKRLSEISAADFLEALNGGGRSAAGGLKIWGDKKKYEYWVEPEGGGGGVLDWWRGRKKWLELEKPPGIEAVTDIRDLIRDPVFIKEMATAVAAELKGK
jgi:hypothetical protein